MTSAVAQRAGRRRSLDGLRGVAALVVVLGHALPSVSGFSGPVTGHYHRGGWSWWVTDTPLAALWDGQTAVYLFFVLSGFVLVIGRRSTLPGWLAYYPARLLRLYVPVSGSLAIALVLTVTVHRWAPTTLHTVVRDLVLVRGVDLLNSPLWSLQWEVIFSLLLPAYLLFARFRAESRALLVVKAAALMIIVGDGFHSDRVGVAVLPIFGLGALLAVCVESGTRVRTDPLPPDGSRGRWMVVLAIVAVCAYSARALAAAPSEPSRTTLVAAAVMSVGGAALLVVLALRWRRLRALLERPTVQWLGTRSFSLYLIHWPIVTTTIHFAGTRGAGALVWLALPVSLGAAEVFYRAVERPAHLLSRRVGTAVAHCATRNAAVSVERISR